MEFIKRHKVHIIALAVIIFFVMGFAIHKSLQIKKIHEATAEGRKFLKEKESMNIEKTESSIREKYSERKKQQMDEYADKINNGKAHIWGLFGDTIIMGDSRVLGFDVFGCLPSDQVIAGGGYTIRNIADSYDTLQNKQPENLILSYGLNDLGIGFWEDPKAYATEYLSIIQELKKKLPHSNIYINLIIPVNAAGLEIDPAAKAVPEYNDALVAMCKENNVRYIDCTEVIGQHLDLYNIDGIHLRKEFYPYWGMQIIFTINEYEN